MINHRFLERPLSHSQLGSFEWNKEEWYQTYILGNKKPPSKEMLFGSMIDKKIQHDPTFLPELIRFPLQQHELRTTYNGIAMIGFPDQLDLDIPQLADDKTGKKPWDQKRADETKQLTMYLFMIFMMYKIPPEVFDCSIRWLPTREDGDFTIQLVEPCVPQIFTTKRTMTDILNFGAYINKTVKEMEDYISTRK